MTIPAISSNSYLPSAITTRARVQAASEVANATAIGAGLEVDPVDAIEERGLSGRTDPDTVELSLRAQASLQSAEAEGQQPNQTGSERGASGQTGPDGKPISDEQKAQIEKLKQRHAEVVQHEQAHVAAAGALYRSGPHYDYTNGPDGKQYATGGHVSIDTSPGKTPEETIAKAARIRAAAMAPAEPSGQDQAVANGATQMEAQARAELAEKKSSAATGDTVTVSAGAAAPNTAANAAPAAGSSPAGASVPAAAAAAAATVTAAGIRTSPVQQSATPREASTARADARTDARSDARSTNANGSAAAGKSGDFAALVKAAYAAGSAAGSVRTLG
jgi:hypothetical protein